MKTTSVRISACIMLVLSMIFVGISLPPQLSSQANSPQADWQFTVEEGKSIRASLPLNNPCSSPHLFRIKSKENFLQFEEPTESVLLEPGPPKSLVARINATELKPEVHNAKLNVECLDCNQDPKCGQLRKEFVVEVTVTKSASQTSQNTNQTAAPNTTIPQGDQEARELNAEGPKIPQSFDQSNFKFTAFVPPGDSPLFLDYELEQPGYVILAIIEKKKRFILPFFYEFRGTSVGRHEELIRLPAYLGGGSSPSVATYTIRALSEQTLRPIVVIIHGLSVGEQAVGSSGLDRLRFEPRDIQVIGDRPATNANYSFRAVRPFNGGAKAYVRLLNGRSSVEVSSQAFTRNIGPGEVISDVWDCKKDGRPSLGKHMLFVKAWFTIQEGGAFAFASSSQVLVRR